MSYLAYINLAKTRMTFTSLDVHQSLVEAAKEDYLGLLTAFKEHGEEKYQFIHLSIQEFLAAWWIAKHEETEEVFKDHFDDDHFRMCLRFVAGLTHLENKIYEEYFNTKLNLKLEKVVLKQANHYQWLYNYWTHSMICGKHAIIHIAEFDELRTLLLQLLYESQNARLCQVFAQSMEDESLTIYHMGISGAKIKLTLFDWLCLGYFFNNTKWKTLYLGSIQQEELSVFTSGLSNDSVQTQCTRLIIECTVSDNSLALSFIKASLLQKLQEFTFIIHQESTFDYCLILSQVFKLPQLKMLFFKVHINNKETFKCTELEKCIAESKLKELIVCIKSTLKETESIKTFMSSIVKGLAQNETITSLDLRTNAKCELLEGVLENLLKHNNTLQALSLKIPQIPSSLNITKVNTPLTALKIRKDCSDLMTALLPHVTISRLYCLILNSPYPPHLISFSRLHCLSLTLDTPEKATELFRILKTNVTLRSLKLVVEEGSVFTICSIGKEAGYNKRHYKKCMSASSFTSILTTGIMNSINSIQQLIIPIYLPVTNKQLRSIFTAISQKDNITELEVEFKLDHYLYSYSRETDLMKDVFYEQVLPVIRDMLRSHRTIKFLRIACRYLNESKETKTEPITNLFYQTRFHSLEQLEIHRSSIRFITTYSKNEYRSGRFYKVMMYLRDNNT